MRETNELKTTISAEAQGRGGQEDPEIDQHVIRIPFESTANKSVIGMQASNTPNANSRGIALELN